MPETKTIDEIIRKYGKEKGALIAILQEIMEMEKVLREEVAIYVAQMLGISVARLYEVITFYPEFNLKKD